MEENTKLIIDDNILEERANQKKKGELTALKVVSAILYALVTGFLLFEFFWILFTEQSNVGLGLAVYLVIILAAIGSIANAVPTILSLIGLIITVVKRKKGEFSISTLVYFIVFTALPYVTEGILFLTCYIVSQTI